jgi:hypothetical protein
MDTLEPTIEYRPIPGFPGYRVGNDGSVWSCHNNRHGPGHTWRRLSTHPKGRGYQSVGLWHDNHRTLKLVQILVLESFVGARPIGMLALHTNDDPLDNRLANLYWGTQADNIRDAQHNNRYEISKHRPGRKTPDADIRAIRQLYARGTTQGSIARLLDMHPDTVRGIVHERRHKDVKDR